MLCVNKKEIKENLTIGEKGDIQYKCNSESISSIYNVSGIGGLWIKPYIDFSFIKKGKR